MEEKIVSLEIEDILSINSRKLIEDIARSFDKLDEKSIANLIEYYNWDSNKKIKEVLDSYRERLIEANKSQREYIEKITNRYISMKEKLNEIKNVSEEIINKHQ